MFFLRKLSRKVLIFLSIAFFVVTLVFFPSLVVGTLPMVGSLSSPLSPSQALVASGEVAAEPALVAIQFGDAAYASPGSEGSESNTGKKKVINFFKMTMGALAGLVLFIFGVTRLSEGLEDLGTDRMKNFLSKCTTNRLAAILTGAVATTLLESSSVTIIMVIAMVSAGVLTFVQSLGVVLGSNIGTAVGAQIISLDIKNYVPLLMFAGLLAILFG